MIIAISIVGGLAVLGNLGVLVAVVNHHNSDGADILFSMAGCLLVIALFVLAICK